MGKFADRYFEVHPWQVIETGFDPAYGRVSESVFSLANEHLGVRGFFDEGFSGDSLPDCFVGGVWELDDSLPRSYKGIVDKTHFMANAVNWLKTDIVFSGERLDLNGCRFSRFRRVLDMKTGVLSREFVWHTASGKDIKLAFSRFLDMENISFGYQEIKATPMGFSGEVEINPCLDFNVKHEIYNKRLWEIVEEGENFVHARTLKSKFDLYAACKCENFGKIPLIDGIASISRKICAVDFQKIEVGNVVYEEARARNERFWQKQWEVADVVIDGDEVNQQGVRFCVFQLLQTYGGRRKGHNIGAKGLTGEAYNGHAFWDTEVCCLPYYLFSNPAAARALLDFRVHTLPQARERAKALDCSGACYPVATLNGEEGCALWQHASLQPQATTAVAYALRQYVMVTSDYEYLYNDAYDMLMEIAEYLASRAGRNPETGEYGYYGVMGPDEFHLMVNNNAYTNYMGKKALEFAAETAEKRPKNSVSEKQIARWKEIAAKMAVPSRGELIEQHDGYFSLPHTDIRSIPADQFPLYTHWSYDRIYRSDMIKQADTLMLMLLWPNDFSPEQKRINYEFYEPRTIHESSLSPSVHSILASELGRAGDALRLFGFATRLDLDNYNRNAAEGLHITSIAAAWQNIVFGFAGLRCAEGELELSPRLPKNWSRLGFKLLWRGALIAVDITAGGCAFTALSGGPVTVKLNGKAVAV
jgi:maltose phosphorylase